MTTDSPKGPEREARLEEALRQQLYAYISGWLIGADEQSTPDGVLMETGRRLADSVVDDVLAPELGRLTAEVERLRQAGRTIAQSSERFFHANRDKAAQIERLRAQYDDAVAEVSRLREQLATATKALADALEGMEDMVGYVSDYFREKWGHDDYIARAKAALAELGVSSSEVEAPQPQEMEQHRVVVTKAAHGMASAYCFTCKKFCTGLVQKAEDWKDQHEADTLRPTLDTLEHDVDAATTHFIKNAMLAEGRPSGSEAATPHWCEGDIAIDQSNFVHRRFEHGWRTWPRESGLQYGDALMESGFGPMLRLDEVPAETDAHGHVPVLVAERVRAAQAARSEATPKWCQYVTRRANHPDWVCLLPFGHGDDHEVGPPSLRKEGEDRD